MKQIFTLLTLLFASGATFSQTANAVVFSENGEKFTLLLNGEKKNDTPAVNVKVSGLTSEFYQARIDFEDPTLADFSNNNFAVQFGSEVTYMIKVNKKGDYVLRYAGEAPIGGSSASAPAQEIDPEVKRYAVVHEEKAPENVTMTTNVSGVGVNQSVTVTETTTTTAKPTSENVGINMNVGGVNMGVNVNMTGMDMNMEENSTSTVTTTTKTTTTGTQTAAQPAPREEIVVKSGCSAAMDKASFDRAKKSVADKGFDDTRLSTAKQVAKSNCLSTTQIVDIMSVFGFEDSKLEFAKYAYDFCVDRNNYYLVGDAFSFSSSVDELSKYVDSK